MKAKSVGDIIQKAKNYATEVMVYDDGSLDNTNYVAKALVLLLFDNQPIKDMAPNQDTVSSCEGKKC